MTIQRHVLVAFAGIALVAVNAAPCAANSITYRVYDSTPAGIPFRAISGVITLDGTLGVVTTANIVNWTLVMENRFYFSAIFVPFARCPIPSGYFCQPSRITIDGFSMVATLDELWFYNQDHGSLRFTESAGPEFMWTLGTNGETINHFFRDDLPYFAPDGNTSSYSQQSDFLVGSAVVPEPSTFWLLGSAIVVGGIRRYRRAP